MNREEEKNTSCCPASLVVQDGIETCEDKCPCGAHLRLHAYTFGRKEGKPKQRFYIDCSGHCGRVTEWHDSIDEATAAFDRECTGESCHG